MDKSDPVVQGIARRTNVHYPTFQINVALIGSKQTI